MIRLVIIFILSMFLMSCTGRHFVVEPEKVPSFDSTAWNIKHAPMPIGKDKSDAEGIINKCK